VKRKAPLPPPEDPLDELINQGWLMTENRDRLHDQGCSVCLDDYQLLEGIVVTHCKHCFHESCLMDWINNKIKKDADGVPAHAHHTIY